MCARRVLLLVIVVAMRGLLVRVIKLRGRLHHDGLTRPYAHTCRRQRGQVLDELAFDLARDSFSVLHCGRAVHGDVELGAQAMPEPAGAHAENLRYLRDMPTACWISPTICGSTPSSRRVNTALADCHTIPKMVMVIKSPMMGSASGKPSHTPTAPTTTARLVSPSVRA